MTINDNMAKLYAFLAKLEQHDKIGVGVLFLIVLVLRVVFLGSSLWHYDAFDFVHKALDFAILGHYENAHLTGYPFWVILLAMVLKIGHLFTGRWSLFFLPNLTAALFGALLTFPLYRLSRKFLPSSNLSLLLVALVLANPIIWRWSEIAMSDSYALFFALYSLVFFLDFLETGAAKPIALSWVCLYVSAMTRAYYLLVLIPQAALLLPLLKEDFKTFLRVTAGFLATLAGVITSYALFHQFDFLFLFHSYGAVLPALEDFLGTAHVMLKSVGPGYLLLSIVGLIFLYRRAGRLFVLIVGTFVLFWGFFATHYREGPFETERYVTFATLLLIVASGFCLNLKRVGKLLFASGSLFSVVLTIYGLLHASGTYAIYESSPNYLQDYALKAEAIVQQTGIDGDVKDLKELAEVVSVGDIVLYAESDWAGPQLLLAGPQVAQKPTLVEVKSADDLNKKLDEHCGKNIYILSKVSDTLIDKEQVQKEIGRPLRCKSGQYFRFLNPYVIKPWP